VTAVHRLQTRRDRRVTEAVVAESVATRIALEDVREILDDRLTVAVQLLADAAREYSRALKQMQQIRTCQSLSKCHRLAAEFLDSIGRR